MPDVLWGVPILFGGFFVLVFVLVIGGILYAVIKGIGQWAWNNEQPVQSRPARLVAKRTSTSGGGGDTSVSTFYHATFEMDGGERQEFGLSGREYGLLAEGDRGTLTFQGTRYKGFARVLG